MDVINRPEDPCYFGVILARVASMVVPPLNVSFPIPTRGVLQRVRAARVQFLR